MARAKQGLLLGTVLLLCSNIFVKGLGFFYRVMLVRLLGAEGIGLVEMVSPLFSFLLVVAGLGVQIALSQRTAADGGNAATEFRTAQFLLVFSGGAVCLLSFYFAPFLIGHFVSDDRVYEAFVALLPAIFIISLASAYRGYFQGQRQISSIGMSQSVEQVARTACGIWLVGRLVGAGIEKAAMGASIATVIGELAGFLYLVLRLKINGDPLKARFSPASAGRLLRFGLPVTLGRLATSGIMMLQAFLIPFCLQMAGWEMRAATEMYGRFSGVAMSLIHLPSVFTSALAVSVMPAVAEQSGKGGGKLLDQRVGNSLQAAGIFTMPGMLILFLFAEPLCAGLFSSPLAAPLVRVLAVGGIFSHLQVTLSSVLQGLGEVRALLINNILAGLVLLAGIVLLVPALGIQGAAYAVDISWLSGFVLNLLHFKRVCRIRLQWNNILFKPGLAALVAAALYLLYSPLLDGLLPGGKFFLLIPAALVGLSYFVVLVLTKGLSIGLWSRIKKH